MTCELFDGDCGECEIEYCPDQIEELSFKHLELKEAVQQAQEDLEDAQKELDDFVEDHRAILLSA